jgi:hypothetical protein
MTGMEAVLVVVALEVAAAHNGITHCHNAT